MNWVARVLTAAAVFSISSVWASRSAIQDFIEGLPGCQLYDFSNLGSFGSLVDPQFDVLTGAKTDKLLNDLTYFNPKTPRGSQQIEARYRFWNVPDGFEENLKRLGETIDASEGGSISKATVIKIAHLEIQNRQTRHVLGDCYKIHLQYSVFYREFPVWVEVNENFKQELTRIFYYDPSFHMRLTKGELEFYLDGSLTLSEIWELRAIRQATGNFERATPLIDDIGGWWGNYRAKHSVRTSCGEEAATYAYFLNRLSYSGLMRAFKYTRNIVKNVAGGWNNHAADVIMNLRTHEEFVLDSWYLDGGSPANLMTVSDWIQDHKSGRNVVDTLR